MTECPRCQANSTPGVIAETMSNRPGFNVCQVYSQLLTFCLGPLSSVCRVPHLVVASAVLCSALNWQRWLRLPSLIADSE